ncbi:MAG: chorismate synthase [Bacteroidales bacterium]|nr:chorismate synthase [Bacteroidales bacterium]
MPGNTFRKIFRLTTFGESHGYSTGGIIDGCPAGLPVNLAFIRDELKRRSPVYPGSTPRNEPDNIEFLSGIMNGVTLGTPIAFQVRNLKSRETDYDTLKNVYRPSHADFTYGRKYGIRDHRGGGRASGRETAALVVGGTIAKMLLATIPVEIRAAVSRIGTAAMPEDPESIISAIKMQQEHSVLQCPVDEVERKMLEQIEMAAETGDTVGGEVFCVIGGVPPGWGEPVFDKLQAQLASAMMSIGTAKGFEYGLGFGAARMRGSRHNDQMKLQDGQPAFITNHDGGIQGGISNGQEIYFRVGFKPVPSVKSLQKTVDNRGSETEISISGSHDICHVPRLVVVVEAMAALVLADKWLMAQSSRLDLLRK